MGVAGSGKTSVGTCLSKMLKIPFYDADDFHTSSNLLKMEEGHSLNDADRYPWLSLLSAKINYWGNYGDSILACSALKVAYREKLAKNNHVEFIFLDGNYNLIAQRLAMRKGHFFNESLLKDQISTLERPKKCLRVSINQSVEDICYEIIKSDMHFSKNSNI
jgi:carbohydrate kinase (thermoresistant glucokinase family)